jgi:hypothetical protein
VLVNDVKVLLKSIEHLLTGIEIPDFADRYKSLKNDAGGVDIREVFMYRAVQVVLP